MGLARFLMASGSRISYASSKHLLGLPNVEISRKWSRIADALAWHSEGLDFA